MSQSSRAALFGKIVATLGFGVLLIGSVTTAIRPQRAVLSYDIPGTESTDNLGVSESSSPLFCGRVSLYSFLRLLGHDVPYSEIEKRLPVGAHGSSLLELRNAGTSFGVELTVCKCDPNSIKVVRDKHTIVLVRMHNSGEAAPETLFGHYLVTAPTREKGKVCVVDGFLGNRTMSNEAFSSIWTGYYLSCAPRWSPLSRSAWAGMTIVALLVVAVGCQRHWRTERARCKEPH